MWQVRPSCHAFRHTASIGNYASPESAAQANFASQPAPSAEEWLLNTGTIMSWHHITIHEWLEQSLKALSYLRRCWDWGWYQSLNHTYGFHYSILSLSCFSPVQRFGVPSIERLETSTESEVYSSIAQVLKLVFHQSEAYHSLFIYKNSGPLVYLLVYNTKRLFLSERKYV